MTLHYQLYAEALAVGVILVIIAAVVMAVLQWAVPQPIPTSYYYIATILSGALAHLISEAAGVNAWYCRHGTACTHKK